MSKAGAAANAKEKETVSALQQKDSGYVTTGDEIPVEPGFLRGHGTLLRGTTLVATVSGFVERVNKLVSVRPLNARYAGEIGDVVIGRVVDVADKRWRLDLASRQHANLMLSSVNLPGGVQRRRTDADSLQMRSLYAEDDLVSAEVQNLMHDGAISLHTRSLKYGKLENGLFLAVPSALIKRCKQHFHSLSCGVDVILGLNGYLWICANPEADAKERASELQNKLTALNAAAATAAAPSASSSSSSANEKTNSAATASSSSSSAAATATAATAAALTAASADPAAVSRTIRERMCRVRNSILALSSAFLSISAETIMDVYDESVAAGLPAKSMLTADVVQSITQGVRQSTA